MRRPESPGRCPEASARRAPEDQGADQSPHDAAEECQGAPRDAARRPQDACQKASGRRPNAPGRGPEAPRRNPKTSRRFSRLGARRSTATRPTSRRACGKATCTRYVSTPHEYHDEKHREPINNPVGWRAFQTTGEMRSTRVRRPEAPDSQTQTKRLDEDTLYRPPVKTHAKISKNPRGEHTKSEPDSRPLAS